MERQRKRVQMLVYYFKLRLTSPFCREVPQCSSCISPAFSYLKTLTRSPCQEHCLHLLLRCTLQWKWHMGWKQSVSASMCRVCWESCITCVRCDRFWSTVVWSWLSTTFRVYRSDHFSCASVFRNKPTWCLRAHALWHLGTSMDTALIQLQLFVRDKSSVMNTGGDLLFGFNYICVLTSTAALIVSGFWGMSATSAYPES